MFKLWLTMSLDAVSGASVLGIRQGPGTWVHLGYHL